MPANACLLVAAPNPPADVVVSCFKLHMFAMLTVTWVLPAFVLRRLEKQVGTLAGVGS